MVVIKDSTAEVLAALESAKNGALSSVGALMTAYAKAGTPVDTGRLRESIGYSISGGVLSAGTSVPYAAYVELGVMGRPGAHFLRNAAMGHLDEYAAILSAVFEGKAAVKGGEQNDIMETEAEESSTDAE